MSTPGGIFTVSVLSLVDQREPTYAVRLALDGREELDLFVLEHLQRSNHGRHRIPCGHAENASALSVF